MKSDWRVSSGQKPCLSCFCSGLVDLHETFTLFFLQSKTVQQRFVFLKSSPPPPVKNRQSQACFGDDCLKVTLNARNVAQKLPRMTVM